MILKKRQKSFGNQNSPLFEAPDLSALAVKVYSEYLGSHLTVLHASLQLQISAPANIQEEERNVSVVFSKKFITYGMGKSDLAPRPSIRQLKFRKK